MKGWHGRTNIKPWAHRQNRTLAAERTARQPHHNVIPAGTIQPRFIGVTDCGVGYLLAMLSMGLTKPGRYITSTQMACHDGTRQAISWGNRCLTNEHTHHTTHQPNPVATAIGNLTPALSPTGRLLGIQSLGVTPSALAYWMV
jgi:hypothetical protein